MALVLAPSALSAFEQSRLDRIAENRRRMEEMGVLESARDLARAMQPAVRPAIVKRTARKERRPKVRRPPTRRSPRLVGAPAEFAELKEDADPGATYSDYESGLDDLLADSSDIEAMPSEKQEQFQELRCNSVGRGSMYDSVVGITCHFCRQKKLCGEEGCPRCSRRSSAAECIGKSDCSRCHGATGRFCRACLLIRYGENLEDVRKAMAAGTWLCPHCYEDEHPDEGWMCNSSICMKRRGYKPTGIAIYDAQQRGFPSVAHWLQAQLRKRGVGGQDAEAAAEAGSSDEAAAEAGSSDEGAAEAAEAKQGGKQPAGSKDGCSSKDSSGPGSSQQGSEASSAAVEAAAVAPGTPLKACEAPTPAAAAVQARVTRAAAAAGGGCVASQESEAAADDDAGAKRACVGGSAGTRRSLRFKK